MPRVSWSSRLAAISARGSNSAGHAVSWLVERISNRRAERQRSEGQCSAEDRKHKRIFGRRGARLVVSEMPMPAHVHILLTTMEIGTLTRRSALPVV